MVSAYNVKVGLRNFVVLPQAYLALCCSIRVQETLSKNETRKKLAQEAASLEASQRGLMEAFVVVVSLPNKE